MTQTQAAALISVAPRTLRDWHDAPRNPDGTYPGPALVAYYLAKMGAGNEFSDQRERLAAAQAEKVEMENAERRGETVRTDVVVEEVGGYISTCCTRLREISGKAASEFDPALGRRVETIVAREVEFAIAELRVYRPAVPVGRAGKSLDA